MRIRGPGLPSRYYLGICLEGMRNPMKTSEVLRSQPSKKKKKGYRLSQLVYLSGTIVLALPFGGGGGVASDTIGQVRSFNKIHWLEALLQ
jgi:hypothetical protein